ncbi:3,9-dihydroxypterocarpan 6A-monooxygenase [Linum grandiflorum]
MELHNLWTWRINDGSTIFISALAVASIMALWLLNRASNRTSLPPGPRGLPIVGYLPFLSTHLHKSFTELAETYGPIYKLWLGSKMYVVIGSPSLAKQVLDHDVTFSARDPPIAAKIAVYGGNDIAFTSYGPEWKKLRKIFVREVLSIVRLDGSCEVRKQEVERAVKDVYGRRSDKGLDFGKLVFMTVSNTVMRMLFRGEESEMFFAKIKKLSDELTVLVAALNVSDLVPVLARFDLQGIEKRSRKLRWEFDRVLDSVIGERRKVVEDSGGEFKDGKDYLQILLDLNSHGDPASSITDSQLKGLLLVKVVHAYYMTS